MKKVVLKKKKVMEDMGGVSSPMSTPMNTPGMGNPTPPSQSTNGIGSGDLWGGIIKVKKKKRKFVSESYVEFLNNKLNEDNVGKFKKNVEIDIQLNTTKHAEERKVDRREDIPITNDELIETVRKASPEIIEDVVSGVIKPDDRFIVFDKQTTLNIVCTIVSNNNDTLKILIITVMRHSDFYNTYHTRKYEI